MLPFPGLGNGGRLEVAEELINDAGNTPNTNGQLTD